MALEMHVFGTDWKRKAIIVNYATLAPTPRWHKVGDFQLTINFKKDYTNQLIRGNIVYFPKLKGNIQKSFLITGRTLNLDGNGDSILTIRGLSLGSILSRRICIPPAGLGYDIQNAPAETAMKNLVKNNITNATDINRWIPGFIVAPDHGRGSSTKIQARYDDLRQMIESLAVNSGLGWDIVPDFDAHTFTFEVYEGTNRSSTIILDPKRRSLKSASLEEDESSYKNFIYMGGSGEDSSRTIGTYGTASGLDRRETFDDARDISNAGDLPVRGQQKLAELPVIQNMSHEVLTYGTFQYGRDYFLGDIVKPRNQEWGASLTTRVVEAAIAINDKGISIKPSFGTGIPKLTDAIKRDIKRSDRSIKI